MPSLEESMTGESGGGSGKATVIIKFEADKEKLKKVLKAASGGDDGDDDEKGQSHTAA